MRKKLFIDFDETLFHHYSYLKWVDGVLMRKKLIKDSGEYEKLIEEFHEPKGENLRLYDHIGHMRVTTGRSWGYVSGELEKALQDGQHDFCYDDAHEFLKKAMKSDWDVRILTYGKGDYQRYKIKTCRVLTDLRIPVHVVTEPKREFLKREFGHGKGSILIDDKHPQRLSEGWVHIWVDRKKTAVQPEKSDKRVRKVHSLDEISL